MYVNSNRPSDHADSGDLVLINVDDKTPCSGLFAFSNIDGPETDLWLFRLTEISGEVKVMPISGRPYALSGKKNKCLGRIHLIVRDFTNGF